MNAASLLPTTTGVLILEPVTVGQSVTFTAIVAATGSQTTPTGTVTFTIDGQAQPRDALDRRRQGPGPVHDLLARGGRTRSRHPMAAIPHSRRAPRAYPRRPSNAAPLVVTSTNLSTSPNPSVFGGRVVLTATVTSADGSTVGGSVTFMEGSTVLGVVAVGPGGKATFDDSSLPVGSNPITAVYSGDPGHARNVSNPVTQVVTPAPTVTPTVASPPPAVVSLQRFGFHMQPTSLVLTFSTALDPASATDVSNYRITTLGGHGRGGSLVGHTTAIKKAIYDPSTFSVTLVPVGRLDIHNRYRLTVNGTSRTGVAKSVRALARRKSDRRPGVELRRGDHLADARRSGSGFLGRSQEGGLDAGEARRRTFGDRPRCDSGFGRTRERSAEGTAATLPRETDPGMLREHRTARGIRAGRDSRSKLRTNRTVKAPSTLQESLRPVRSDQTSSPSPSAFRFSRICVMWWGTCSASARSISARVISPRSL